MIVTPVNKRTHSALTPGSEDERSPDYKRSSKVMSVDDLSEKIDKLLVKSDNIETILHQNTETINELVLLNGKVERLTADLELS